MFLAKELGRTLEDILDMTTLEWRLWAAYYMLEKKDTERTMNRGKHRTNNTNTRR